MCIRDRVNESGVKAAAKYPGVEYWLSDWQTEAMTQRKYRINAEQSFYKQEYCGCTYSLRDSNHWREKEGLLPKKALTLSSIGFSSNHLILVLE